eukprot:TRINITY_DN26292_c0_g1_i1.p1 TRINITY_DN26292_c0_g1~~TRINITY_DN26292_c0_g1_i1.p1  ORF type:complete len:518 (+),score=66.00 TRINITY_DN26292_c0_g1_i1:167-1720(+)
MPPHAAGDMHAPLPPPVPQCDRQPLPGGGGERGALMQPPAHARVHSPARCRLHALQAAAAASDTPLVTDPLHQPQHHQHQLQLPLSSPPPPPPSPSPPPPPPGLGAGGAPCGPGRGRGRLAPPAPAQWPPHALPAPAQPAAPTQPAPGDGAGAHAAAARIRMAQLLPIERPAAPPHLGNVTARAGGAEEPLGQPSSEGDDDTASAVYPTSLASSSPPAQAQHGSAFGISPPAGGGAYGVGAPAGRRYTLPAAATVTGAVVGEFGRHPRPGAALRSSSTPPACRPPPHDSGPSRSCIKLEPLRGEPLAQCPPAAPPPPPPPPPEGTALAARAPVPYPRPVVTLTVAPARSRAGSSDGGDASDHGEGREGSAQRTGRGGACQPLVVQPSRHPQPPGEEREELRPFPAHAPLPSPPHGPRQPALEPLPCQGPPADPAPSDPCGVAAALPTAGHRPGLAALGGARAPELHEPAQILPAHPTRHGEHLTAIPSAPAAPVPSMPVEQQLPLPGRKLPQLRPGS